MAFHVACPITCKRICFCSLGFPRQLHSQKARESFLDDVFQVEEFLRDDWIARIGQTSTVQVVVPKVTPPLPPAQPSGDLGGADGEDLLLSAQTKRAVMQRKAAAALVAAEDYARKYESGDLTTDAPRDVVCEDQGLSNVNVMCRLCFHGENEGSVKAKKMLSCKSCGKKYHRNCIKLWAQHRDLFHWTSWTCPSCRICEVCRRTGDPNKFIFCKRCDAAYHCYCQQPPHKNVSNGPFLCPKHTKCHSCGSTVPGNGLSTRWFLGYTCCDACGRLFVKGNYCPVCLKVYRDSESTPMVCCDICQRWVHCVCDGISDERYLQFQVDRNLQYKCAVCRGRCYQVKDLEDAVHEIWRRRDEDEKDLIAALRANAGLPTQDEIFYISPYSDDEEMDPSAGRSLKFSLKGLSDKTTRIAKDSGKTPSSKKHKKKMSPLLNLNTESHQLIERNGLLPLGHRLDKNDDEASTSVTKNVESNLGNHCINPAEISKYKLDQISASNEERKSRFAKIKSNTSVGSDVAAGTGKHVSQSHAVKGTKLVIHLGARNRNVINSPRSDVSSCLKEHELTISTGSEDGVGNAGVGTNVEHKPGFGVDDMERDCNLTGQERVKLGHSNIGSKSAAAVMNGEIVPKSPERTLVFSFKRSARERENDTEAGEPDRVLPGKHPEDRLDTVQDMSADAVPDPRTCENLARGSKPLLKLKLKNPSLENDGSWALSNEDTSCIKGQRSKRKRPLSNMENARGNSFGEIMEANWVLKKLGKDAIGKRVEVQHPSDHSWHKGVVRNVVEASSSIDVYLDDGSSRTVELGKHSIRFVSQKSKP